MEVEHLGDWPGWSGKHELEGGGGKDMSESTNGTSSPGYPPSSGGDANGAGYPTSANSYGGYGPPGAGYPVKGGAPGYPGSPYGGGPPGGAPGQTPTLNSLLQGRLLYISFQLN